MQDILREKVKLAKVFEGYTYKTFADYLNITHMSFYNWLGGRYNLSECNYKKLNSLLTDMLEN